VVFEYVMGSSVLDSCHPQTEMGRAFGGLRRMNLSKLQIRIQSKGYESYFRLGGVGASLQVDDSGYGVIFRHATGGGKGWRVQYSVTLSSSIGYVVETPDARLGRDVGRRQRKHRKSDSGVLEFHPPPLSSYQ
jgi:hypothetical protein